MPLINWSDSLESVDSLTDTTAAQLIARQLQASPGVPQVEDLSDAIGDIVLGWTAQGASILELHIIDPFWQLLTSGFVSVDDAGLLVPLEVNYPDGSDCYWWLAQCVAAANVDGPNLTLTFEDRSVAQMRDVSGAHGGRKRSYPGESREHFIGALVAAVPGCRYWAPSAAQLRAAGQFVGVGNAILTGTTNPVVDPPKSSRQKGASPQRRNPAKRRGGAGTRGKRPTSQQAMINKAAQGPTNQRERNPAPIRLKAPPGYEYVYGIGSIPTLVPVGVVNVGKQVGQIF